jgi:glutathione synthase/RimK-type ligase-like ATP-grasp enzyme
MSVVYLLGPSDDSTTRYFAREATALGADVRWIDLGSALDASWHIDVGGPLELCDRRRRVVVPADASVYARLIAPTGVEDTWDRGSTSQRLLTALASWLEMSNGRIVNRPGHTLDNGCKPLHEAWLRAAGFLVPPSLTSSDRRMLRSFAEAHRVVVKTVSGIRADCFRVGARELRDFHPEQGPIHLQHAVDGIDVRVHVVGNCAIAVGIQSRAVDYRIADDAHYFPFELPLELADRIVEATRETGLTFAGWDFKLCEDDGRFHALEVNPMPGYQVYDRAADLSITRALLDYFEGRS